MEDFMRTTRLALLTLIILALGLMGTVVAQEETATPDPALEAADAAANSTADLVLAGWSSSAQEDEALNALLAQFTEETGITVDFIPSPNHPLTMQTAFASGDYANVFYIDSSILPDWVDAGVVDVGEGKIENPEGFYPDLLDVFTIDGILYCPPKDFSTMALQYNRDLFDQAGLAYPTPDWTWDDLQAAAEALSQLTTAEGESVTGLITPLELPRFLPFLYQAGGSFMDDEGNITFDSPETRAALDFYAGFSQQGIGGAPSVVDAGWGGEAFGEGRAGMAMEGNWVINYLLENYPELNWGVTELPAGPAGKATMAFTVCYGVAADNDNPEASWQLVNFLTGEEGQARAAEVSFGPMPTRPSAAQAYLDTWAPRAEGLSFDPADINAFVAGADYSHRWQFPVGWQPVINTFNEQIQRLAAGEITTDDLIFEVNGAIDAVGN
jgi:multiple sugar transport system substrate-binding protein